MGHAVADSRRNDPNLARDIFSGEHEQFRETVRRFVEDELVPFHAEWEKDKGVPREVWRRAGEVGILCPNIPEEYGGLARTGSTMSWSSRNWHGPG